MAFDIVTTAFPDRVFSPGSDEYSESINSYYSAFNIDLSPALVIRPESAQEVAKVVKLASSADLQLAVKGTGYTPWAGAANIEGGLTVDMRNLRGVQLSEDYKMVSISAGEKWGGVYKTLHEKQLATIGGRVPRIGVVGLTLGGGLSYFSGKYGFVCDAVIEFEVVLSTGDIVVANRDTRSDLFAALKGGSNNFGIVTRIVLPVFEQNHLWGGMTFYAGNAIPDLIRALVNFTLSPECDENANILISYGYAASVGMEMAVSSLYHCDPPGNEEIPESLRPFASVEPKLQTSHRRDSVIAFTEEQGSFSKDGGRSLYFTTSFKPDENLVSQIRLLFLETIESLKVVQGITFSFVMQPITKTLLQNSAQAGPNAMGLGPDQEPFLNMILNPVWDNASDDERVRKGCLDLLGRIDHLTAEEGKSVRWRFLNYGFATQKVIESYGSESVDRMQEVSRKYDPSGFFQHNVRGGFKLQ